MAILTLFFATQTESKLYNLVALTFLNIEGTKSTWSKHSWTYVHDNIVSCRWNTNKASYLLAASCDVSDDVHGQVR